MSYTPNYQGVFLRGYGSQYSSHYGTVLHQSDELGILQGDAIRNITGTFPNNDYEYMSHHTGAFYYEGTPIGHGYSDDPSYCVGARSGFDASRVVPTDTENRPVNIAVKYLIKAK